MKNKWLNFWYHYKLHTILGLFLAVIIAVSVWQFATSEKYDYKVYLYLSQGVTSEVEQSVKQAVEKYAEDVDENGEINVCIINLSYSPYDSDGEKRMAYASTLAAELNNCENFCFLTDDYRFKEIDDKDIYEKCEFFKDKNGKAMILKGTKLENNIAQNFKNAGLDVKKMPEMLLCLKKNPGKDSKHYESYQRDLKLINNIVTKGN